MIIHKPLCFLLFLLLLLGFGCHLKSQTFASHQVALTPELNPSRPFNEESLRAQLVARYSTDFKTKEELDGFVDYLVAGKKQTFESNYIYTNLPEVNAYVRRVLNRVIPKRLLDTSLKIYIVRDPELNASVMGDGSVFVNIGFLAGINNEAELAAVLGHEFGHYEARHQMKRYKALLKSKSSMNSAAASAGGVALLSNWMRINKLSRKYIENELESDNYGIQLMRENKFAPAALRSIFTIFQKLEKKHGSLKRANNTSYYFRTHPTNANRVKNVEQQFSPAELDGGEKFFYDSLEFNGIKQRAIDESIHLYFEAKDYSECLEMAYKQHLFYPNDEYYLFYIVECLQRQLKLNEEFYKLNFITWRYDLKIPSFAENDKPRHISTLGDNPPGNEYANTIFYHLTDFVLDINDDELMKIKNKALVKNDTLEFVTNLDALQFFRKKLPNACAICNLVFNKNKISYGTYNKARLSDIEQKYIELSQLRDTIESSKEDFTNSYSIIYSIDSRSILGPYGGLNYELENNLYKGFVNYSGRKEASGANIKLLNNLSYRDESTLRYSCSNLASLFWPKLGNQWYRVKVDLSETDPELLQIMAKQKAKKLFFSNIILKTDINLGVYDEENDYIKCGYTVYCLDIINNSLDYSFRTLYLKDDGSFNALYESINKSYQELIR